MSLLTKKGQVVTQVMVFGIILVFASALLLALIQFDVISVKSQTGPQPQVLNTQFLPGQQEGKILVKDFVFCSNVDESFTCLDQKQTFAFDEEVHFRFVVQTTTQDSLVRIAKNYQILGPGGDLLLDLDQRNNFNVELASATPEQDLTLKDSFYIDPVAGPGEYTLRLVIENEFFQKKATVVRTFTYGEQEEIEYHSDVDLHAELEALTEANS